MSMSGSSPSTSERADFSRRQASRADAGRTCTTAASPRACTPILAVAPDARTTAATGIAKAAEQIAAAEGTGTRRRPIRPRGPTAKGDLGRRHRGRHPIQLGPGMTPGNPMSLPELLQATAVVQANPHRNLLTPDRRRNLDRDRIHRPNQVGELNPTGIGHDPLV